MNCVNDFNKLINFINQFPDNFAEKLNKCYHITTKVCPYNSNWYMFSYSQFESDFTNPVVRGSRGTVLEIINGKVTRPICLPFYKFNNLGQEGCDEVNWDNAEVQLKVDGCCDENTVLITPSGKKTIKEICEENYAGLVWSFDFEKNEEVWTPVECTSIKSECDDWYELELENGKKIKLTGEHKVWIKNLQVWRKVEELSIDDDIDLQLSNLHYSSTLN